MNNKLLDNLFKQYVDPESSQDFTNDIMNRIMDSQQEPASFLSWAEIFRPIIGFAFGVLLLVSTPSSFDLSSTDSNILLPNYSDANIYSDYTSQMLGSSLFQYRD